MAILKALVLLLVAAPALLDAESSPNASNSPGLREALAAVPMPASLSDVDAEFADFYHGRRLQSDSTTQTAYCNVSHPLIDIYLLFVQICRFIRLLNQLTFVSSTIDLVQA